MHSTNQYPDASEYAGLLSDDFELREATADYHAGSRWTERHLQCVWYNTSLRPAELATDSGEPVEVESCGRWNLEAGPDFIDAGAVVLHPPDKRAEPRSVDA